jgi:HIRAN domain-containing protein
MLDRFCRTTLEWRRRRVPELELVKVAGVEFGNDDGSDRQQILGGCQESMRVVVRRAPNRSRDSTGVDLFVLGGQQIGHLSAEVSAQIAPLLDSDRTTFDAVIWSVDEFTAGDGRRLLACTIAMTRFERVPVKRFLWTLALLTAARGAKWTVERSSSALGWLGRSTIAAVRSVIPNAGG